MKVNNSTFGGTFPLKTDGVLTKNSLFFSIANYAPEFGAKLLILLVISAKTFSDILQFGLLCPEGLALLLGDTFFYQKPVKML